MSTLKTHNLQSPDAGSVNIALAPNAGMVVTGVSTFSGAIDANGDLDVDGHTNLDNVSIAGVTTSTGNLYADNLYAQSSLTINSNSNVSVNLTSTSTSGSSRIFFGDPDSALVGRLTYSHNGDYMQFFTAYGERLRITSAGHLKMPDAAEIQLGNDTQSATGDLRLFHNGSNSGIINSQGALYVQNTATNSSDLHLQGKNSIQFHVPSDGTVPLHILNTGEVRIKPRTNGSDRTQFSFNNSAHTPFISFKSNNLNDAAEIRVEEDGGGSNIVFKNKNRNSALHTCVQLDWDHGIYTAEDGNLKSHPIISGMYTSHDAQEGQLNYHSLMSPDAGIGGWVFLGTDYAAAPYPVRTFKIAVPEGGNSAIGTRVYQLWHNGDANYDYGGLYEIRINQWNNSSRFESVSIRCINGKRDDVYVVAYNNTNGIMIRTSTIWGSVYIRKAGWDENQLKRGSSYCAVENNGALAIYNAQGTDDGTVPTSGSPYNVYCFDAGSHTGGRDIENNNNFAG